MFFALTYGDGVGSIGHRRAQKVSSVTWQNLPLLPAFIRQAGLASWLSKVLPLPDLMKKPETNAAYVNGGFFYFLTAAFFDRYLNDREDLVLERDPLQRMAEDGELMMYAHEGFWHHMDTPHEI